MQGKSLSIGLRAALATFTMTLFVTSTWAATHESVLHAFKPNSHGNAPYAGLIFDASKINLYGTTSMGGAYNYGTVFELTPREGGGWTEKVLHNFGNGTDGSLPYAGLIFDAAGNLYGTTRQGGDYCGYQDGCGTVFEMTPNGSGGWTEKKLHNFGNGTDGSLPEASLIFDAAGNLYGTTLGGGTRSQGTVFALTPNGSGGWTEKVLHNFGYGTGGLQPSGGLIFDGAGNLYGTTSEGGSHNYGTVFELTPNGNGGWTEKKLHNFGNGTDGADPEAGLIFDAGGNLYGTTYEGGAHNYGTVFEMMPNGSGGWTEKKLHNFNRNGTDGYNPEAALLFDSAGHLYSTTYGGGDYYNGTVFELTPNGSGGWTEKKLHSFNNKGADGEGPIAGLIFDSAGHLYSTTFGGGDYYEGTVFELTPNGSGNWAEEVLHSFNLSGTDAAHPYADLIFDAAKINLYGTTYEGGDYGGGTVFELTPIEGGGWRERVLHSFNNNGADGFFPYAGLIVDASGNLYGTTLEGGIYSSGTAFELTPNGSGGWTETVLHNFNLNGTDGATPFAGLTFDAFGNLYGTTSDGGDDYYGTVFELTPTEGGGWTEKVLHSFNYSGTGGYAPLAGLIFDTAGNLYGTTAYGGTYDYGTVFELTPTEGGGWTEEMLHSFNNDGTDGANPQAGLIFDAAGNLYGTTVHGGIHYSSGTVFELTPAGGGNWTEEVLHNFNYQELYGVDGAFPYSNLIFDAAGNLYGTTAGAGTSYAGTAFELTPTGGGGWTERLLFNFGGTNGVGPNAGLIFDDAGNLYGTTYGGGTYQYGVVFEITP